MSGMHEQNEGVSLMHKPRQHKEENHTVMRLLFLLDLFVPRQVMISMSTELPVVVRYVMSDIGKLRSGPAALQSLPA